MLCDTASFLTGHICLSDRIQNRCLAVVNMTHDTDDRRSLLQGLRIFLLLFEKFFDLIDHDLMLTEDLIFECDLLGLLI